MIDLQPVYLKCPRCWVKGQTRAEKKRRSIVPWPGSGKCSDCGYTLQRDSKQLPRGIAVEAGKYLAKDGAEGVLPYAASVATTGRKPLTGVVPYSTLVAEAGVNPLAGVLPYVAAVVLAGATPQAGVVPYAALVEQAGRLTPAGVVPYAANVVTAGGIPQDVALARILVELYPKCPQPE